MTNFVHPVGWINLRHHVPPHGVENVPAHFPTGLDKSRIVPDFFPPSGMENVPDFVHQVGETVNVTVKSLVKSTTTQRSRKKKAIIVSACSAVPRTAPPASAEQLHQQIKYLFLAKIMRQCTPSCCAYVKCFCAIAFIMKYFAVFRNSSNNSCDASRRSLLVPSMRLLES